jgi:outer membrane biosynthesis protein TonB
MPNLQNTESRLEEWKNARGQIKSGEMVQIEGNCFYPSMKKDEKDGNLASIEKMIVWLEERVESAKKQLMDGGEIVQGILSLGVGASAMILKAGLELTDLADMIPTGKNLTVSSRDVRVFANYKGAGKLEEYRVKTLESLERKMGDDFPAFKAKLDAAGEEKPKPKKDKPKADKPKTAAEKKREKKKADKAKKAEKKKEKAKAAQVQKAEAEKTAKNKINPLANK